MSLIQKCWRIPLKGGIKQGWGVENKLFSSFMHRYLENGARYDQSYSLAYIFAADSMGLFSFKFVQWAAQDASILQQSAGRKRIFTSNSHSRSFILQSVTGRQGPYNNAGLISEDSEVVATQISKNCRRRPPHAKRHPHEYPHKPYISRN